MNPIRMQIPEIMMRALTTKARFIVLIGGRGSGKSEGAARIILGWNRSQGIDILCGRELQNSIDESVHKMLKVLISEYYSGEYKITDKKIDYKLGGGFRFKGLAKNPDAVKSYKGFKVCWIEEAQALSTQSIKDLLPTIRENDSKFIFTGNPQSSEDPFSVRFIKPFLSEVKKNGFYEDEQHLIIMVNWRDNPWFPEVLNQDRLWDYNNLTRAEYDHIWEGEFNDSVENALIKKEWFDSCIDAHKVLGFEPLGFKIAAHDPSDEGGDAKGYAVRHGSIVLDVCQKTKGDIIEGAEWATGMAINSQVDMFIWDVIGMGAGLKKQISVPMDGKGINIAMFNGGETPFRPGAIYDPVDRISQQKTNKQTFRNKRAQNYFLLRDRVHRTHRAVTKKEYHDPDKMISFDSGIECMDVLRSELSRMPVKPNANGMLELYTKEVMKTRFGLQSPNLADSVMMLMTLPPVKPTYAAPPQPRRTMGGGAVNGGGRRSIVRMNVERT